MGHCQILVRVYVVVLWAETLDDDGGVDKNIDNHAVVIATDRETVLLVPLFFPPFSLSLD